MNASEPRPMATAIASDIVSVNPGNLTLGALHPEGVEKLVRHSSSLLAAPTTNVSLLNAVFASKAPGANRFGMFMLLFRLLFSALLIVSGIFILVGEINAPATPLQPEEFAIAEIAIGGMIALGFMTRLGAIAGALGFGYISVMAILSGVFDMNSLVLSFVCLVFAMLGGGKFSVDSLIRKAGIRHSIRKRERLQSDRLSYKAYRVS